MTIYIIEKLIVKDKNMTLARFMNYIQYSTTCPHGINLARWKAMIKNADKYSIMAV